MFIHLIIFREKAICVSQSGSYLECLWLNKKKFNNTSIDDDRIAMVNKAWEKVAKVVSVVEIA